MSCPINLIIIVGIITVLIANICRRTTGQSPSRPAPPSSSGTTGQQEVQFTQRRKSTRNPWTIFSIPVGYYQLHATSSESELKDIFKLDNNQLGFCENKTILAIFNNINLQRTKDGKKGLFRLYPPGLPSVTTRPAPPTPSSWRMCRGATREDTSARSLWASTTRWQRFKDIFQTLGD